VSRHGGDIHGFARSAGVRPEEVIDFSASINPLGVPRPVMAAIKGRLRDIEHYPDPEARQLKDKLSEVCHIDGSLILCGNGCTELIYLLPRVMSFDKVLIPQPTFVEYERACKAARPGCVVIDHMLHENDNFDIDPIELVREAADHDADAVFLCNPNNPTGRLIEKENLAEAAAMAAKQKIYLIVDESFIEFTSESSMMGLVEKTSCLIVLRSMTKFYALPGLRLGWGVFPSHIASGLGGSKEPWSVNALAQAAGIAALQETNLKKKTLEYIERRKRSLESGFTRSGIEYVPSGVNYYLLRTKSAPRIIKGLKQHNIIVRDCAGLKGLDERYMRVAVKKKKENDMLMRYMELYS